MHPEVVFSLPSTILTVKEYAGLKDVVMIRHKRTKPVIFEKLMSKAQMTERPSAYLHELMSTASQVAVADELVCQEFIQALPPEIILVIAAVKNASLPELGRFADEIVSFLNPRMV